MAYEGRHSLAKHPKVVFLDAVQTIMDLYPDLYTVFMRIAQKAGWEPDPHLFRRVYDAEYVKVGQRLIGKTDFSIDQHREKKFWRDIDASIFKGLGLGHCCERLADEFFDEFETGVHWRLYDETLPTIRAIREMGMRVAVISNGTEGMQRFMDNCEFRPWVDFVLVSAAVGWEKPGPEIFNMALKKAGIRPEEAIHVGDNYECDVMGARGVGIMPVWVKRDPDTPLDHCLTISRVDELLHVLRGAKDQN